MDDIMVSINCITYNHEKYIRKALESFLMQKTNFKFEILVHDDVSTDKTPEIIKEYQEKYPNIVKPILQKENQYVKYGYSISYRFNDTRAKGKYIAMCEGDDYWIDSYKLQKQVDYMENNPKCTMCFHNSEIVHFDEKPTGTFIVNKNLESRFFTAGDLLELGFIPTASVMYRKDLFKNLPSWYFNSVVGDLPIELINTSYGYAYYDINVMSCYRRAVPGSATDRFNKKSVDEKIKYLTGFIDILDNFNEFSKYKYSNQIDKAKILKEIEILRLQRNKKKLKNLRYKEYFDNLDKKGKIKWYIKYYFPNLYAKLVNIKLNLSKNGRKYE